MLYGASANKFSNLQSGFLLHVRRSFNYSAPKHERIPATNQYAISSFSSNPRSSVLPPLNERKAKQAVGNRLRERQHFLIASAASAAGESMEMSGSDCKEREGVGYLVSEHGWQVRRLADHRADEVRKVAQVQAEAFHVPMPLFNDLFFEFFQAEVLSGLLYKLRNSSPNRYACLVAMAATSDHSKAHEELVGMVDVTVQRDESVLQHLQGVEEYLYVSGIAVLNKYRRQKVATALLKACDALSFQWGFEYLVLRAYEDDLGARKLYANAGYRVVSGDPLWVSTWIGRKRRVVMIKQLTHCT